MAYSNIVKNEAFLLFVIGYSSGVIAKKLSENHDECVGIDRSTIQTWAKDGKWKEKREEENNKLAQTQSEQASLLVKTAGEKIRGMIPGMLDEIGGMTFSSKEGGVYAVNALLKSYREFSGELRSTIQINGEEEVVLFLKVLDSIPEIKMVIDKYRIVIGEKLEVFKNKEESEKLIEEKVIEESSG